MGKKEITPEDILRNDMKYLIKELNQKIKLLGPLVYYSHSGFIYVKNTEDYLERVCAITYPLFDEYTHIAGILSDTDKVYEMYKEVKFSKARFFKEGPEIIISQENMEDKKLNYLCPTPVNEKEVIQDTILPMMYKKMNNIIEITGLTSVAIDLNYHFTNISEADIDALRDGLIIDLVNLKKGKDIHAYITKQIFPLIKYDDEISYTILDKDSDVDDRFYYFLFREKLKDIELVIYTLTATYQNI